MKIISVPDEEPLDAWVAQKLAIEAAMDNQEFRACLEKIEKSAREGFFSATLFTLSPLEMNCEHKQAINALENLHYVVSETVCTGGKRAWTASWA